MWTYYLRACAGSFRARYNDVWQLVLSRGGLVGRVRARPVGPAQIPAQPGSRRVQPFLDRPEVHRERDEVVHLGNGARVEREVERLHVAPARLAGLDPNGRMRFRPEVRELRGILLVAGRAADARERPLGPAERAGERARRPARVRHLATDAHDGAVPAGRAVARVARALSVTPCVARTSA